MAGKAQKTVAAETGNGEPVAKPGYVSRHCTTSHWVPGHYPQTWAEFTDAQLSELGLKRPSGDAFAPAAPAAAKE